MTDSTSGSGSGTAAPSNERRLESWGEIASYLRREIRTVQRWERNLGLPIHRLSVGKNSSVYAYPSELDKWYKEREPRLEKEDPEIDSPAQGSLSSSSSNTPQNHELSPSPKPPIRKRLIAGAAVIFLIGLLTAKYGGRIRDLVSPPKVYPIRLLVRTFTAERGTDIDAEGFTDELISKLSKTDARLIVIAPTSAEQLRGKTLAELWNSYRVQYV